MRSFLRLASFASFALGSVVWLASAPTIGCGGGSEELPADTNDTGVDPDAATDGPDNDNPVCGNGFKEGVEQCDDKNSVNGDGCENDCTLTCKPGPDGDKKCNDSDPCNGVETCGTDNKCIPGTPLADGDSCGEAKICRAGTCVEAACGDGIKSGAEECDDANAVNGDGCDNCKFSCLSTDTARNCSGGDACAGTSTCDDTTHKCKAGTPLADGTSCGTAGGVCKSGVCAAGTCGDGVVSGTEQCDFGSGNGAGTGCEVDCKFSCSKTADACSDGNVCNGVESCQTVTVSGKTGQKCQAGTAATDGTACGTGLVCKTGVCVSPSAVCGNGVVESGEDCDFGTGNGAGTGCETTCKFSCTKTPADSCNDGNPCNGTETCATVTVGGKTGQKCNAGTALAACAACGTGAVCVGGLCKTSSCGDSCVDAAKGETCDPPASGTCDTSCKNIVAAVCGDGVRTTGEQCDDSGKTNLDGCNATCGFEQDHRANNVRMQGGTSTLCKVNALGGALNSTALSQLQTSLDTGVQDGSISILFQYLNLDPVNGLLGLSDSSVNLGVLNGAPVAAPTGVTYDGRNALDWWYNPDPSSIDSSRLPTAQLTAAIGAVATKTLTAGPGNIKLVLSLSGTPSTMAMSAVQIKAPIGAATTPKTSTGATPGHLASEHLDPTLTSFETTGVGSSATNPAGELCGNISAASLAKVAVPAAVLTGGSFACGQGYTTANSMLDVLVNGCTVFGFIQGVAKTQPDQVDPTAPVAGAGGLYKLSINTTTKKVETCKDKSGATVDLTTCLNAAAYSSYFKFSTQRVILK